MTEFELDNAWVCINCSYFMCWQVGGETQGYVYSITPLGTPFEVRSVGNVAYIVNTQPLDFESQSLWTFTVCFIFFYCINTSAEHF